MRVVIADDDRVTAEILARTLRRWEFEPIVTTNGAEAWKTLREGSGPTLAILDWMMPELDGPEVCRLVRRELPYANMYLILVTARESRGDVVAGLDAGADDYLVKPFDFGELLARIRALQRRPRGVDQPVMARGRIALDPVKREVTADGRPVALTGTEYHVLELLIRRSPAVVDRKAIAEHAWADETDPLGSNAIDVQLSRLRAKLPDAGIRIVTVRGAGYRLDDA